MGRVGGGPQSDGVQRRRPDGFHPDGQGDTNAASAREGRIANCLGWHVGRVLLVVLLVAMQDVRARSRIRHPGSQDRHRPVRLDGSGRLAPVGAVLPLAGLRFLVRSRAREVQGGLLEPCRPADAGYELVRVDTGVVCGLCVSVCPANPGPWSGRGALDVVLPPDRSARFSGLTGSSAGAIRPC